MTRKPERRAASPPIDPSMQRCIDLCQQAEALCIEMAHHHVESGRRRADAEHVPLLLACAEICRTTARFMLLRSEFHVVMCELCAKVCEACADDGAAKRADDVLARCIEACRRCARACREMSCPGAGDAATSSRRAAASQRASATA